MPTVQAERPRRRDFQYDFSGGANPFTHPTLLKANEAQVMTNCVPRSGGGIDARGGYKLIAPGLSTDQGTAIFEMEQTTGTVLTFVAAGPSYYDETMSCRYRWFNQTPGTGDIVHFGAREPFNEIRGYIVFAMVVVGNTFVFEYWNGSTWVDFTASVFESVTNSKQMRGATGEWIFSWGTLAGWVPNQVEQFHYQYWIRIRCTLGGTNGGSDVVQSQRRVGGDWVGRRHMMTADTGSLFEWPGMTLNRHAIETWANERIARTNAAVLNDHLYYAGDGQRALRRWNGSRGTVRAGGNNNPSNAGLSAPAAPTLNAQVNNANGYPNGWEVRYRCSWVYGPAGILGESPASPSLTVAVAGHASGFGYVTLNLPMPTAGQSHQVHAIRVYATYNVAGVDAGERDRISEFYLVKIVTVDDADWTATTWQDQRATRSVFGQATPIPYTNTPPFFPKGIVAGGNRLWIWDENNVAWSDIQRGDSWNPENQKNFGRVRGCLYRDNMLLVWTERDIHYIKGVDTGLPEIGFFWRGVGLAHPDTIAIWDDAVYFISPDGPARIVGRRVEWTGRQRVWESASYWEEKAPYRRIASAAAYKGRIFTGIDYGATNLRATAALDLNTNPDGAWSRLTYSFLWGTYGVIHAPLDHALAREKILCAFPAANHTADYYKLAILQYGTTDNWTTLATDGTQINTTIDSRAITMRAADRWKAFHEGHLKLRHQRTGASGTFKTTVQMLSLNGRVSSKTPELAGVTFADQDSDLAFYWTEFSTAGRYRETACYLRIIGVSDTGWRLVSWLVSAEIEEFRVQ